ncbi:hypothetical protein [Roseovarius pacificus]|uniref:hypothetical protein n=1 Tax=Roseovarius pacificus TaxID=337701 RepID=UPI002A18E55F|nr:hypothetical protein [Roseovarius pacificus]
MRQAKALLVSLLMVSAAQAQEPLSAIDWLDEPVSVSVAAPLAVPLNAPPVADGVAVPRVTVMPLDAQQSDSVGLLPGSTTGLPTTLWQASTTDRLSAQLSNLPATPLPATQALYYTLLLAEADAPADAGTDARFLKARLDALSKFGAVDPALALMERAGPETEPLFDRWLDLSLLAGAEDAPCAALAKRPSLSPRYSARIFCTARAGDWQTAALTYETAQALGLLTPLHADLLAQFLDPETIDDGPALAPPPEMTPLTFRLYEAMGRPLPTGGLPRAYAMADLRPTAGWKARLEAAERLAQAGALPSNRLLGLYTERKPAASGGVWDRVAAIQDFDRALSSAAPERIAATLPAAWRAMRAQGLQIAFAELFGEALIAQSLPEGPAAALALRIALLSPAYESAAPKAGETLPFLAGLARGAPPAGQAKTELERSIVAAFTASGPAPAYAGLLNSGKLGQAILTAALSLDRAGPRGFDEITDALSTLRAVGLEDTARRAALQLLLLESRG